MILADILRDKGIDCFAAIRVDACAVGNERLHSQLPCDTYAIFMLFPYYVSERNSRLATFAAVPDYHIFGRELFSLLEGYITEKYGVFARGYTDHSPLEERDGAARCGLGIIGRHGLLISEKYSSFVCIGELICALSEEQLRSEGIEVRSKEIGYCDGCGICIRKCPGRCADGDKSLCISAITQKKGELTEAEADAVYSSGSVWGCDVCQLSCPHTERAMRAGTMETKIPYFYENVITGDESDIEALKDEDYKKYTFSYRKRNVMQRNIDIVRRDKK